MTLRWAGSICIPEYWVVLRYRTNSSGLWASPSAQPLPETPTQIPPWHSILQALCLATNTNKYCAAQICSVQESYRGLNTSHFQTDSNLRHACLFAVKAQNRFDRPTDRPTQNIHHPALRKSDSSSSALYKCLLDPLHWSCKIYQHKKAAACNHCLGLHRASSARIAGVHSICGSDIAPTSLSSAAVDFFALSNWVSR